MPLDRTQARKDATGAEAAYARSPHGAFIMRLAGHVRDALDVLDTAATETTRAMNETARLKRELDEEKTHYRKLREQTAHSEAMLATLREIAGSKRGGQAKATAMLQKMDALTTPVALPKETAA